MALTDRVMTSCAGQLPLPGAQELCHGGARARRGRGGGLGGRGTGGDADRARARAAVPDLPRRAAFLPTGVCTPDAPPNYTIVLTRTLAHAIVH